MEIARSSHLTVAATQLSSGLILGLSSVIYAISYAALMFPGKLAVLVPHAITVTLITAIVGGVYGLFAEEATLVNGPDANTSSVLAGTLAAGTAASLAEGALLNQALVVLLFASVIAAAVYLLIERFGLARMVRFIPFQVMAGFLASTGWLMSSGALGIMSGTPLTLAGLQAVRDSPWRPELLTGLALTALLLWLNRRYRPVVAVPVFMLVVSVVLNIVIRHGCPQLPSCEVERWFFQPFDRLPWTAPWELRIDGATLADMAMLAPSFLAVAFVGTLTLLLSLSSLEHTFERDFHLEPALRAHGLMTLASASLGGYMGMLSVGRTLMCRQTGGGRLTGLVSAAFCLAVLLGLASVIAWIPKVALGALVLSVGIGMLLEWFWNLRRSLEPGEWWQIAAILVCVVAFGYVVGFTIGLLAACIFFVVTYSRMPSVRMATTLATVHSSCIREVSDQQYLGEIGERCRIGRFDGYVFFGVANSIYDWYLQATPRQYPVLVLDFSHARGMDHSAATVIGKIIRSETARAERLILAVSEPVLKVLRPQFLQAYAHDTLVITRSFDTALELAEEYLLAMRKPKGECASDAATVALALFESATDREDFLRYLERKRLAAGEVLFEEGQASSEMYFIEQGQLEVVKSAGEHVFRLAKVVTGSMIGEMALYSGQPRTATVRAVDEAVLLMLTLERWQRMQHERPELARKLDHHVILGLAARVSRANVALSQQES